VVKTWVLATLLVIAPAAAFAQQPSRAADIETIRARQKISIIEGSFERAVQNGADNFSRQLQAAAPNADGMAMLMGAPVVRGFRLPSGGVFFDVQMPSLQLSMVWPLRYAQGADAAASAAIVDIRNTLERVPDAQVRFELTQKLRQLEAQVTGGAPRRGRPGAQTVSSVQGATASSLAPPPASPDTGVLDDPAEAWRREVRATLVDAMIENTGGVTVGPEEYVIVAARGVLSSDRLVADPGDARTIELSVKGSDLDAYRAHTITLEDARKRVMFREY
jgi:hypothetical protein